MTDTRRIPINVDPLDGEALDSWLEALAYRTQSSWGDLVAATGLDGWTPHGVPRWMVNLTPDQCRALTTATTVGSARLGTMTLSHFEERAMTSDTATGGLDKTFPWGPRAGSRYCPHCLAETGGRWPLAWRLRWSFACLKHRCLLADACPACTTLPRIRQVPTGAIPRPGHCTAPLENQTARSLRCGAKLTTAEVVAFDRDDHLVLHAQRRINDIINAGIIDSGVYAHDPQPPANVLADIRVIAVRALAYATPRELEPIIGTELRIAYQRDHPHPPTARARSSSMTLTQQAPSAASLIAAGTIAALHCLDKPDVQTAGDSLRWLITAIRRRRAQTWTTNLLWTGGVTGGDIVKTCGSVIFRRPPIRRLRARPSTVWG